MRAVIQRVSEARVSVEGETVGEIGTGLLILLGIGKEDTFRDAERLAQKIVKLRIFSDQEGKMNLSALDISAELLVISQFTLYGDTRKGNRPSYSEAARAEDARLLYAQFIDLCQDTKLRVQSGVFQAQMHVYLVNSGPVTLLCDSNT